MTPKRFIHLHTHSAYSLAEGAITVKALVKLCAKYDMPAVAVTDTNNLFGAMEFAVEAAKEGVQPIIGVQIDYAQQNSQLVLLAQTEAGYRNLCKMVSDAYMSGDPQAAVRITRDLLAAHAEGVLCLTGGVKGPLGQCLLTQDTEGAEEELRFLKEVFEGRLYIEIQRHGAEEEDRAESALIDLAYKHGIPLAATNDCYFAKAENYEAHDALLCIAGGRYISEEDRRRVTREHFFKNQKDMIALFADLPEAVLNTEIIARRCSFLLEPIDAILPAFPTAEGRSEFEELKAQAEEGLEWRLENFVFPDKLLSPRKRGSSEDSQDPRFRGESSKEEVASIYRDRLEYELGVIQKMGYPGYFLIVSDFIRWAKGNNIPVGPGRGSGAASVVAWSLQITDLDPMSLNLVFERFLNPERVDMPDFDIDFCQERRDEVIRYVQGRYGKDRVAQIITFGKLQARAVVRDVGRVLQLPYGQVDRIAKMIPNNPAQPTTLAEALAKDPELQAERDKDETNTKLIEIALQLEGLYRHASTHAAGVVIGDRPLHDLLPVYRDPRSDMPVTQFSMKYVGHAGLVKFDFLGLKTMTVIQKTLDLITSSRRKPGSSSLMAQDPSPRKRGCSRDDDEGEDDAKSGIDLLKIPLDDAKTYEMIAAGHTVGVFQLESAGMRDALRRVKPTRFEDIIALVSLYRPGPMDNIPTYAHRKHGREETDYMHEKLQPYLEETHGIIIYQEQVMQAAQILAGYTLGGADLLRRAMGKKIKAEMDAQREQFIDGAKKSSGIPRAQAEEIFEQIDKFVGYGFNKAHAAAYALISYWTAWLKANHPLEFMAASMTLDLGNTDKLSVFKQDLDRMNVKILPPDINKSLPVFSVDGDALRYALAALKGVGEQAMQFIAAERARNGPYKSLDDFVARLDQKLLNRRQFEQLACAGGFDSLNPNRAQMAEAAELVLRHAHSLQDEKESGQVSLFAGDGKTSSLPPLPDIRDWTPLEKLSREFSAVGFYLTAHPLDTRQKQFENLGIANARHVHEDLQSKAAGRYHMAGVLLKKQEKISARGNKYAFLQLSDPTGIYEVTLFSELLTQSRQYLEPGQALLMTLEVEQREDQIRFTAQKIEKLDKALESKIREIQIHLTTAAAAPKIKACLDSDGRGQSAVTLHVALEDGRMAHIQLPGQWALSAQSRDAIRAEAGVREILEA